MRNKCEVKITTRDEETGGTTSDIINLYDISGLSRLMEKIRWNSRYTIAPYSGVEYQGKPLFLGDTVEFSGETLVVSCDERGYHLEKITRVELGDLTMTSSTTITSAPAVAYSSASATPTVLAEPRVVTITDDEEREVPGFLGYSITSSGTIYSTRQRGKKVKRPTKKNGYDYILLRRDNKCVMRRVDYLIALAFIDDTLKDSHNIVHKNGDLNDNSVGNLIIKK